MLKIEEIDWDKAKIVVESERDDWYEDYDEAEGIFMGWRKIKGHKPISFSKFSNF